MSNDNEQKMNDMEPSSMDLMPLSKIGPIALECAEGIEQAFGKDAKVMTVTVVVEVMAETGDGYIDSIEYASSDPRRWVQLAMLQQAVNKAETLDDQRIEEVDEELDKADD